MTWKGCISALALLVLALGWTGCETGRAPEKFVCTDDEIRIGDTLIISLLDIPEPLQEKDFVVRSDGMVNLPQLGPVQAKGKKYSDFEQDVQRAYIREGLYRRITVVCKPGVRHYTVGGEVKGAASLPYTGPTTVLRAIATAGGFTEYANRRRVEVIRAGGQREVVDCVKALRDPRFDLSICPGDHVSVPRSL
jgi:polysaccharide biosynthesis/export protein VpsN